MHEEYLDVLNENGELAGESKTYAEVHKSGLIHRAIHVWIFNSEDKLLIQRRSSTRQAYPNYWDMSVGGHVSSGQTSLEAAQREVREELGLTIPDSSFRFLFTKEENFVLNHGTYVNNEFVDTFLVQLDLISPDIKFADGEVSKSKWVSVEEFKNLITSSEYTFVPHYGEYERVFEFLNK